jgi:hypothetical protein
MIAISFFAGFWCWRVGLIFLQRYQHCIQCINCIKFTHTYTLHIFTTSRPAYSFLPSTHTHEFRYYKISLICNTLSHLHRTHDVITTTTTSTPQHFSHTAAFASSHKRIYLNARLHACRPVPLKSGDSRTARMGHEIPIKPVRKRERQIA